MEEKGTTQGPEDFGAVTKLMAKSCDNCALCNYARENPDKMFGKFMHWHGTWCPAWKAHQKVYGEGQPT